MKIKILKKEFEQTTPVLAMEKVTYTVETKYFKPVKDILWFKAGKTDKYIRVAIKEQNMYRCFQPSSRMLDCLFTFDKKHWKPGVKLSGN